MTSSDPPTLSEATTDGEESLEAAYDKAVNLFASGQKAEADALLARILDRDPMKHGALHLRGVIAALHGDPGRGVELIEAALALDAENAAYWGNLGTALKKLGWLHEAAEAYGRAMALDPKKTDLATNLGLVLEALGQAEEAIAAHRLALQNNPGLAPAAYNLGRLLAQQGRTEEAIELLREAIEINPRYLRAHNELGVVFQSVGDEDAAIACFRAALDVDPAAVEPLDNLMLIQGRQGRFDEIESDLLRSLQAAPEQAETHVAYGLFQLRRGRLAEGWSEYAWRWKSGPGQQLASRYPMPIWEGAALGERRLLVWAEPGLSEQLLFSTLLPDLAWQGGAVTVACDPGLLPLFERSFDRLSFVAQDSLTDPEAAFDCQIPLGALPRLFRAAVSDFPKRRASLTADVDRVAKLGAKAMRKAKGRLMVAIARSDPQRAPEAPPGEAWLPLLETSGCRFFALQAGAPEPALAGKGFAPLEDGPIDWQGDLEGLAAQLAAYDLVIAEDERAAHLAGSLGVRAWILLPKLPSWCWMLEREDSPWYPSLRLFRQDSADDWQPVIARLTAELGRFVEAGAA